MTDILTVKLHLRYLKQKVRSYPRIKERCESENEICCITELTTVQEKNEKKKKKKEEEDDFQLILEINVDANAYGNK